MVDGREVARALMALDDETFARVVATGDFERLGMGRGKTAKRGRSGGQSSGPARGPVAPTGTLPYR